MKACFAVFSILAFLAYASCQSTVVIQASASLAPGSTTPNQNTGK